MFFGSPQHLIFEIQGFVTPPTDIYLLTTTDMTDVITH